MTIGLTRVPPKDWPAIKPRVERLISAGSENHITIHGKRVLHRLSVDDISSPGNTVWIATDVRKIVGAYAVADYGKELSVVVVDKDYRGRGLGHQLVNAVVSELGSFYAEVSGSNLPSLKMMFSCGLVAYDAFVRPRDPGNVILRIKYPGPPAEVKAEKS